VHAVATSGRTDLTTFRVVVDAVPGALLLLDHEGHVLAWGRDVPDVLPAVAGPTRGRASPTRCTRPPSP